MKTRIAAIHFPTPPSAGSLPDLAAALLRFSPRVGIRPPDTLYADIASTIHLFGGEERILKEIGRTHTAIADDAATAGVLARYAGKLPVIVPAGRSDSALAPLPIDALRFLAHPLSPPTPRETRSAEELLRVLSLLGIGTLGDFARIPASTIGPRFGLLGVELHRRSRGASSPLLRPFEPTVTYRESREFEDPVAFLEPLLFVAKTLLLRLEQRMEKDWNAALEMAVYLETEDSKETGISVPLHRPLRKSNVLFDIVRERLSAVALESSIRSLTIEVSLPVKNRGSQFHLFDAHEQQGEQLAELLGRLVGKLGPTVVAAAVLRERHRPETTWEEARFDPLRPPCTGHPPETDSRPTLFLPSPKELKVRTLDGKIQMEGTDGKFMVSKLRGPERLSGEWWKGSAFARDYFVAETESGQHLWIFKSIPGRRVFLHGYFD